jgi:hypothetical protein
VNSLRLITVDERFETAQVTFFQARGGTLELSQ